MQLPVPCYLAATSAHAVQVAACPSIQHHGRSKLRRFVLHHTASQAGSRSQQLVTKALQTEEKPTAQKKRGRKKGTHPELPSPANFQQTVKKSFTLGGLGLHTGEYAYIRVRPAYADEGRYFVRVPKGTNSDLFTIEDPIERNMDESLSTDPATTDEENALQLELYYKYLHAQAEGFDGDFEAYVTQEIAQPVIDSMPPEDEANEEVVPRSKSDNVQEACLASTHQQPHARFCTTLGDGDDRVQSVEHLLSALEGFGVDNARIEIEGGPEVPIVDGSALGWAIDLHQTQLCPAQSIAPSKDARSDKVTRKVLAPKKELTLRRGDAFITFFPEGTQRLTYGIDHLQEAPIIGKQWFSWAPAEDKHYRWHIAPARTYAASLQAIMSMRQNGLVKGGTEACAIIGYGNRWYEPGQVRFMDDEPVRHKMLDLIGDLSLIAEKGHAGLPMGHIIAYKADHEMHIEFAKQLKASCSPGDWVNADKAS
ncbi:hypothetical protein WJX79_003736 [Trebouxia sp. C0005]